jgi:chemotaxis protein CheD
MSSNTLQSIGRSAHTVDIADLKATNCPTDVLITYSLGSCIGLTVYDPAVKVGGLIHCQLPLAKINPAKAAERPAMFTDTGVAALLQEVFNLGGQRQRLIAKLVGAACMLGDETLFKIGERNQTVARKVLWKNDILLSGEDVGGSISRTVSLHLATGRTIVKAAGEEREL